MMKLYLLILILIYDWLAISAQPFNSQQEWESFFINRKSQLNPIEGIWSQTLTFKEYNSYNTLLNSQYTPSITTFAIYKDGDSFKAYNLHPNDPNARNQFTFLNTATPDIYLMELFYPNTATIAKANVFLKVNGLLEFSYEKPVAELKYIAKQQNRNWNNGTKAIFENQWLKLFPSNDDVRNRQPSSGSGFNISSNGIIVTNHHVIDGANIIKVRGVNSDFSRTYNAKALVIDRTNDLALIQIDDLEFKLLDTTPFLIKTGLSDVGESVFVLGYPLRATMGDEIKLTTGIISSKTGYKGDITSYQISAPAQPGNSGGPLFDSQGNLIGIVNAKHVEAENATYAIKSSYLTALLELVPQTPKLQTVNLLSGKTLSAQVEMIKKFVYIIETE